MMTEDQISSSQSTNLGSRLTGGFGFCSHGSLQLDGQPAVFAKIVKFWIISDSEHGTLNTDPAHPPPV